MQSHRLPPFPTDKLYETTNIVILSLTVERRCNDIPVVFTRCPFILLTLTYTKLLISIGNLSFDTEKLGLNFSFCC